MRSSDPRCMLCHARASRRSRIQPTRDAGRNASQGRPHTHCPIRPHLWRAANATPSHRAGSPTACTHECCRAGGLAVGGAGAPSAPAASLSVCALLPPVGSFSRCARHHAFGRSLMVEHCVCAADGAAKFMTSCSRTMPRAACHALTPRFTKTLRRRLRRWHLCDLVLRKRNGTAVLAASAMQVPHALAG
jgi:hypothetical protein